MASPNPLRQQIDQISREKNINPGLIIAAIEDAILTASKKYDENDEDLRSRFNDESGQIEVFAVKQVVTEVEIPATQISLAEARTLIPEAEVGAEIEFPKATDVLGRIAAQTATQAICHIVHKRCEAGYSGRLGEVLTGIIERQKTGDFVVDLGLGGHLFGDYAGNGSVAAAFEFALSNAAWHAAERKRRDSSR